MEKPFALYRNHQQNFLLGDWSALAPPVCVSPLQRSFPGKAEAGKCLEETSLLPPLLPHATPCFS